MAKCNLKFLGYEVLEMDFKKKAIEEGILEFNVAPKIGCNVERQDNKIDVYLSCVIRNDGKRTVCPFDATVRLAGHYEENRDEECKDYDLTPNAIAILYPYLRSTLSSLTMLGGVMPYLLPAININALLEDQRSDQESDDTAEQE